MESNYPLLEPLSRIPLICVKNMNVVTVAAKISLIGSAKNTANTLFSINIGKIKINGINNTNFRKQARSKLVFACPSATNVCWQQIWNPKAKIPAI